MALRRREHRLRYGRRSVGSSDDRIDLSACKCAASPGAEPGGEDGGLEGERLVRDRTGEGGENDVGGEGFAVVEQGGGENGRAGVGLGEVVAWGEKGRGHEGQDAGSWDDNGTKGDSPELVSMETVPRGECRGRRSTRSSALSGRKRRRVSLAGDERGVDLFPLTGQSKRRQCQTRQER